ncbi:trp operon leader peptide [Salmonella enterica]
MAATFALHGWWRTC